MIDLHIHTSNSDGKYSTIEILKLAESKNINTISICDHNRLEAYRDLEKIDVKEYFSGEIINGIEFDITYKNRLFHMLGYKFDVEKLDKCKFIDRSTKEDNMKSEIKSLDFFKSVCKDLGIKISENLEITSPNVTANDLLKADMMKYKENEEILDKLLGKNREISFWRGHITNPESPFFIDYTKGVPSPKEVADEIHKCGGIVILPHIFEYKSIDNIEFLNDMYEMKILDGIECIHTKHSKEQIEYLKEYAKEKDLLISGGSDFHNENKQTLGYGANGTIEITDEYCIKKVK